MASVAHRVAEDLFGAAKDGSAKVLIVASVAHRVAEDFFGAAKDGSAKVFVMESAAHRVAEDLLGAAKDGSAKVLIVAQDFAFWGPGGARPLRHATTTAAAVFAQLAVC